MVVSKIANIFPKFTPIKRVENSVFREIRNKNFLRLDLPTKLVSDEFVKSNNIKDVKEAIPEIYY